MVIHFLGVEFQELDLHFQAIKSKQNRYIKQTISYYTSHNRVTHNVLIYLF